VGDDGGVNIRNVLAGKYTPQQIDTIIQNAKKLPYHEQVELMSLLEAYEKQLKVQACQTKFIDFVKEMWPAFIPGRHHAIMADAFERVAEGKCKRLIINMAPRHSKSEFSSYLLPAWYLGKYPDRKIIQTSHTAELAVGFGRKVRNLVGSSHYQTVFPGVALSSDSKAAGRWNTSKQGEYFAIGVGGSVSGKGSDLLIIDDPHALLTTECIPTPNGFKTVEELRVGDFVYGPDGLPVEVLAKSEVWKDRELYRLTTDDGESIMCDGGHLWPYMSDTNIKKAKVKNATARELAEWSKPNRPCLPRHHEVQYPHKDLPIDPYVLGYWLGNGTSSLGRISADTIDIQFIRSQFELAGYETTDHADPYSFGALKLMVKLRDIGVLNNKHIPEEYFTSSVEQRLSLIQGLMDSDGNVTIDGQCSFNNTNRLLSSGLRELVHSLGVKASVKQYEAKGYSESTVYRVNFKLFGCCRLPRKRERTRTPTDKRQRSYKIEKTDLRGDVQCITVNRPDGLFLAGRGYVVTHNSEQEATLAATNPAIYDGVYEWYTSGPRQRLQPGGAIVVVMTRWSKRDLCGQILKAAAQRDGVDEWEVIEFPAIMPSGQPLWPEFWSLDELSKIRAELPVSKWSAQYQQNPTSEEGALIKRDWWKIWDRDDPPNCEYIIQSWDTALTKGTRSDYSACTTWGVFYDSDSDGKKRTNIILLNAFQDKLEFPELKQKALEEYRYWKPDSCIIEAKAAGAPLVFEMRRMGIPIQDYTPSRGNDKIARVNAVSDIFASGFVYAPPLRWAEEVIEQFASFPNSDHDDLVDSSTQALLRFRQGGFISTQSDEDEEPISRKKADYY